MTGARAMRAKVSAKGWVVIPAPLRRKYGIEPGMMVEIEDADGRIVIFPGGSDPVEETYGKFGNTPSLLQDLLAERAKERKREQAKIRAG